jgi:N6-adenosine-specific RNA methylase IME4
MVDLDQGTGPICLGAKCRHPHHDITADPVDGVGVSNAAFANFHPPPRKPVRIDLSHMGSFKTIVADPPWDFSNRGSRAAAVNHYRTMTAAEIAAMIVPAAENAHLYLWTTDAHLSEALATVASWGFIYKQVITWSKAKAGRVQMGLGNYWRHCTEHVLFAVRGRLPVKRHNQLAQFDAPREAHSRKPDEFFRLVESMSPGPRLELFARRPRRRWTVWGNEVAPPTTEAR